MGIDKIFLCGINPFTPTVYDDGLSYMECVAKLQAKINECIDKLNGLNLDEVRIEMQTLKNYVDNLSETLTQNVAQSITNEQIWVMQKINDIIDNVDDKINRHDFTIKNYVKNEIEQLRRDVNLIYYSPVTGGLEDIQTILIEIYHRVRDNGITAGEYDNADMTASNYATLDISAYEYDMHAKDYIQF